MTKVKYSLTEGPLFSRLITFSIPIMLTGVLQAAYTMVGGIIVGQYSSDPYALAAIGSTTYLIALFTNALIGLSTGAGIVIARLVGSGDKTRISRATHTSMAFSLIVGLILALGSLILSEPILVWLGTTEEAFLGALLYFRLIMIGIPAVSVYNFGNSILRSVGDSKTPLYVLAVSGFINIALSYLFVVPLGMSLDGVAFATVISQYVSALWVTLLLIKRRGESYGLRIRELRIHRESLGQILLFGIPAAIQSALFSLSNLLITNSINSLGPVAMSSMTVIEMIVQFPSVIMSAFTHSATTILAQNLGAENTERSKKTVFYSIIQMTALSFLLSLIVFLLSPTLLWAFMSDTTADKDAVYACAKSLMDWYSFPLMLCGIMDVLAGLLRGFGKAVTAMLICLPSIIILRVLWIIFLFPLEAFHSLDGIYWSYPTSWGFCILLLLIFLSLTYRESFGKKALPDGIKSKSLK